MMNVQEEFASNVFNDEVMQERLPKDVYNALRKTIITGKHLEIDVANVVANAMKDWAVGKGATHFTHWFQPMTGVTAEKHDSFISPKNDKIIMEFSGKELVKGEPDASSFPSGGLRATFEARGYTGWDPSSYAFIKETTLYIPTVFLSYSGEALDMKTPLLRSMQALDKQAIRILRLFNNTTATRVTSTVGAEQEYFLVKDELARKRLDLINCGRTLFGSRPSKGQELEDHYFGAIKKKVFDYMNELDEELWKLGIPSKTKHNEVAPCQHELAPIFENSNIATDHNQIIMETMKNVAKKHNMTCLLAEKPFAYINGSGKHNNWSISTNNGENLLDFKDGINGTAQFLLILTAIISAVDEHQDLLRIAAASSGNDHRLGANEAPPAIVSVFLGEELTNFINCFLNGTAFSEKKKVQFELGASVLPHFNKDSTDRNRTSPFAFTGNKFEFRMLGSNASIADTNIFLNTMICDKFKEYADILENAKDFKLSLNELVKSELNKHKRIIFNGDGYSQEWVKEAKERGLLNLHSTVDALPYLIKSKNIDLFKRHGIFSEKEILSRYEVLLENYSNTVKIEADTLVSMIDKSILGSALDYQKELLAIMTAKQEMKIDYSFEKTVVENLTSKTDSLYKLRFALLDELKKVSTDALELAKHCRNDIIPLMEKAREIINDFEGSIPNKYWNLPTQTELLTSID